MALLQAPFLMNDPSADRIFPPDVIARAKKYLSYTSGGVGEFKFELSRELRRGEIVAKRMYITCPGDNTAIQYAVHNTM